MARGIDPGVRPGEGRGGHLARGRSTGAVGEVGRKGYARAALSEIESYACDHGCVGVQLHVHGANTGARQLYLRAGFVETDVTMLKRVASDS